MNLSSVIVQTRPEFIEEVISYLKNSNLCEYHLHDENGRIVITIEDEGVENEVHKLQQIQKMTHVISADMVFSYAEVELDSERDKLLNNNQLPEWLNNPDAEMRDIRYHGDLKGKY